MGVAAPPAFRLPGWDLDAGEDTALPQAAPVSAPASAPVSAGPAGPGVLKPAGFTLPGWDDDEDETGPGTQAQPFDALLRGLPSEPEEPGESGGSGDPAEPAAAKRASRFAAKQVIGGALVVTLGLGGVAGIAFGILQAGRIDLAPAPPETVVVSAGDAVRGPADDVETNAGRMSVEKMAPLTYFIPAMGVYSEIVPSEGFDTTMYDAFQGLEIPEDPSKTAWFSGGGRLAGNQPLSEGTTLLASHVTAYGQWGVLKELGTLKGGELVYVKDADGTLSAWKVTELHTLLHTEFPQEYWAGDGERRLVITTCAGYDERSGFYTQNIFAVAEPVDPETGQPFPEPVTADTADTADHPGTAGSGDGGAQPRQSEHSEQSGQARVMS